ncbi:hypothetical protein ECD227_3453 [Escherichia fergusonii ECD227]|nr:hypothetical protein ECD227_3453 [Escherichia fergusonii ECD227]
MLRNNLALVVRVNTQKIQRRDAFLVNQFCLCRVWCRQDTIRITNGHLRQIQLTAEHRRVSQPCCALISQNGVVFHCHAFTLRLSIK